MNLLARDRVRLACVLGCVGLLGLSGCTGGSLSEPDTAGADTAEVQSDVGVDQVEKDTTPILPEIIVILPEDPSCTNDEDCEDGPCLDAPEGGRCAAPCGEEYPCEGAFETCREIGDGSYCVSDLVPLCRPCEVDDDCDDNGLDVGAACIGRGDAGSYCAVECPAEGCPDGYTCKSEGGQDVCLPASGGCGCNQPAIRDGASTTCTVRSAAGACAGTRACGPGGLSACSAAMPVPETCNGVDDDCDGDTDEGFAGLTCMLENEHGACWGPRTCVEGAWACDAPTPEAEACDGLDNDCDGMTDEPDAAGCATWYRDADQDGVGRDESACLCAPGSAFTAAEAGDCDDDEPLSQPGLFEFCDGLDNDCNVATDEDDALGCAIVYRDGDRDGLGDAADMRCLCAPEAPYDADEAGDCADGDEAVRPGATEICNGIDDDCDGQTDAWAGGTCWVDAAWGYKREVGVTGNLTGRILKDVQFPVDFTSISYDNHGLQLSLHFNEGDGAFIADSSGNGNHATPLEQTAWEFGKEFTAMTFDGQNDCVRVKDAPSLRVEDAISIVLWFKWNGGNGRQSLISRGDHCASEGSYNLYLQDGQLRLSYAVEGSLRTVWRLDEQVQSGAWRHLAVTLMYSAGQVGAWLDGAPLAPALLEGTAGGAPLANARDVHLGCQWMYTQGAGCAFIGARDYFRGTVDEVRVYGRALGAAEVTTLMNRERGMYNVGDVRITQDYVVRMQEIAISEIGGVAMNHVQFKVTLDDPQVLERMTRDARDLRLYPAPTDKPYGETYTGLPFWVEDIASDHIVMWVKVSLTANTTKHLYLYYGNPQAKNVSSFDAVFTKDPDSQDDLLLAYPFDETVGQVAYDQSGKGTNATLANVSYAGSDGGQWGESRDIRFGAGNSLLFNGTNSHAVWNWPTSDFVLPQSDFAVEMWILPTAADCGVFQMENQEDALDAGNALLLQGGRLAYAPDGIVTMISTDPLVLMEWHHVILSVDSLHGTRLYVDGALAATTAQLATGYGPAKVKGHLGYAALAANRYFKGNIDAFRIVKRAIGTEEAVARYQRSRWVFPTPQVDFGAPVVERTDVAQLNYWVESDRSVWVEVPFVRPGEDTPLRLYYANVSAYPQSSFASTFTKDPDAPDDQGLLAEWHLDTKRGNWMYDDSKGSHDGLLWNFTWGDGDGGGWASRRDVAFSGGSHLIFNGETSYVEMPYDQGLSPTDAFSIEFWLLWSGPKGQVDEQQFLQKGRAYGFAVGNGGVVQGHLLYHFLDPDAPDAWTSSGIVLEPNVWSHVALTWDGYTVKLFEDGKLIRTEPFLGQPGVGAGDRLMLGAGGTVSAPTAYYFGKLDEVKMYERTLHPLEVKAHAYRHQYVLPSATLSVGSEEAL